jgi:excisionase family DNA binding protein
MHGTVRRTLGGRRTGHQMNELLTVAEAAERLGITKEAIRKRIHRGTLRSDKDADGTVRVYLPLYGTAASPDRELLYGEMRGSVSPTSSVRSRKSGRPGGVPTRCWQG